MSGTVVVQTNQSFSLESLSILLLLLLVVLLMLEKSISTGRSIWSGCMAVVIMTRSNVAIARGFK